MCAPSPTSTFCDVSDIDPGLGVPDDSIDMVIGEVKEGRVGVNTGVRDPEVLNVVIGRLGDSGEENDRVIHELLQSGVSTLPSGVVVRLIAFGAFPPGAPVPPCRIISLGHVLEFLQSYVRRHLVQSTEPRRRHEVTPRHMQRFGRGRRK